MPNHNSINSVRTTASLSTGNVDNRGGVPSGPPPIAPRISRPVGETGTFAQNRAEAAPSQPSARSAGHRHSSEISQSDSLNGRLDVQNSHMHTQQQINAKMQVVNQILSHKEIIQDLTADTKNPWIVDAMRTTDLTTRVFEDFMTQTLNRAAAALSNTSQGGLQQGGEQVQFDAQKNDLHTALKTMQNAVNYYKGKLLNATESIHKGEAMYLANPNGPVQTGEVSRMKTVASYSIAHYINAENKAAQIEKLLETLNEAYKSSDSFPNAKALLNQIADICAPIKQVPSSQLTPEATAMMRTRLKQGMSQDLSEFIFLTDTHSSVRQAVETPNGDPITNLAPANKEVLSLLQTVNDTTNKAMDFGNKLQNDLAVRVDGIINGVENKSLETLSYAFENLREYETQLTALSSDIAACRDSLIKMIQDLDTKNPAASNLLAARLVKLSEYELNISSLNYNVNLFSKAMDSTKLNGTNLVKQLNDLVHKNLNILLEIQNCSDAFVTGLKPFDMDRFENLAALLNISQTSQIDPRTQSFNPLSLQEYNDILSGAEDAFNNASLPADIKASWNASVGGTGHFFIEDVPAVKESLLQKLQFSNTELHTPEQIHQEIASKDQYFEELKLTQLQDTLQQWSELARRIDSHVEALLDVNEDQATVDALSTLLNAAFDIHHTLDTKRFEMQALIQEHREFDTLRNTLTMSKADYENRVNELTGMLSKHNKTSILGRIFRATHFKAVRDELAEKIDFNKASVDKLEQHIGGLERLHHMRMTELLSPSASGDDLPARTLDLFFEENSYASQVNEASWDIILTGEDEWEEFLLAADTGTDAVSVFSNRVDDFVLESTDNNAERLTAASQAEDIFADPHVADFTVEHNSNNARGNINAATPSLMDSELEDLLDGPNEDRTRGFSVTSADIEV
ncbi:MAG: hypothetical protein HWE26_17530 [Alteromonadaceae bacterium]|nr:hypothetical protein [Alteromonadaceae bacterium]